MKRSFDVSLAVLLLPVAAIVTLVYAALCLVRGDGPALFRQERVGRGQARFTLYKLRTMEQGTADRGSHEIPASRITPPGRILRKTKLDEVPQVWNVLTGDMSFVGPRPCLPCQTALVAERAGRGVFAARPGITGPAQLMGVDMSTPRALAEIDAAYATNLSFRGDLALLLRTASGAGRGDAVRT